MVIPSMLVLYNVLFVKSIGMGNRLTESRPFMNGTFIGTTFVWNSRNVLIGMGS